MYNIDLFYRTNFLGAKAPLQPTSSEALYVCMSVCMYAHM